MKLMYGDEEVKVGDILDDGEDFEGGVIINIDYINKKVDMHERYESWECSEEFNNLGELKFVE